VRPLGAGREVAPGIHVLAHFHRSNVLDVYDAWSEHRACRVMAKTLRPDRLRDRRAAAALVREGRLLRRLAHPHLVRAYEVHPGARPVVVLETLGGETLGHLIERSERRLSAAELAHLGTHLASALRYLHAEGILHLDLKPSNVVAEAGRAKVLDLSLAHPPGRVRPGRGTWSSMAPEQARGGEVTAAADVFGLGTVLYEAVAGVGPFDEHEELELPTLHVRAAPLRTHRRAPAPLLALVDACLEPEPSARPTVDDVLAVLAPLTAAPRGVPSPA
jgi:serine/threonine protein kinase